MVNMWTADKIYYRNSDNFIRAYQGNELVWQKIVNNVIYYTSTNDQVVTPDAQSWGVGVNLISNTYSGGQGVMTFDGPVTSIGNYAFYGCSTLETIVIPDSATSIGNRAFYGCTSLTSINLPSGVTMINNFAFCRCSSLSSIDLSYVTSFGSYVLEYCTSLSSVILNSSLTSIPTGLFKDCSCLTSVTIPSSVTNIGDESFRDSGVLVLELPSGVTNIGNNVFTGSDLISLTIPSSVTSMGVNLCFDCGGLIELIMYPTTPPSLGQGAFTRTSSSLLIKVPSGSVQAYQSASVWRTYADRIVSQ